MFHINYKRIFAIAMAGVLGLGAGGIRAAASDTQTGSRTVTVDENEKPYLALGEDLKTDERATVLGLLGIKEADLDEYDIVTVTNDQEHEYLDSYIPSDKIGSRALSSVVVLEGEKGSGIHVTTKNISYCTTGMYENALATAGMEDAEVIVAGPFSISGTAALIGAIEAYSVMTGEKVDEQIIDGAINEIVTTGEIEETTGSTEEVEGMIAYLKEELADSEDMSDSEIRKSIQDAADEFEVTLTKEEEDKLIDLLRKLQKMDLDWDSIANQAQSVYDRLKEKGLSLDNLDLSGLHADDIDTGKIADQAGGFFSRAMEFFRGLFRR